MERWLNGDEPSAYRPDGLADAVRAAAHLRFGLACDPSTTAYRLVHGAADLVPGVTVDRYEDHLVVALTGEAVQHREQILDGLDQFGPAGIYLKLPSKQASRIVDPRRDELAPSAAVRGAPAPASLTIRERGLEFEVRLGDGLSTGIFLDQRDNRNRLRRMASGVRVLNLFAYTGAFTVAAIAGGARSTVTVDASRRALARAKHAIASTGADELDHRLECADALSWLRQCAKRGEQFDVAVLDPPSFATTKRTRFRATHDYRAVAAATLRCLAPGGRLLACTNHRGMSTTELRRVVVAAADDAERGLGKLEAFPPPIDFPTDPERGPHLKTLLAEVGDR